MKPRKEMFKESNRKLQRAGLLLAGILALAPASVWGAVVYGVDMPGEVPIRNPGGTGRGIAMPPPDAVVIDFDDAVAPVVFIETVALSNEYADEGVIFSGPGGNDGGAVLDSISFPGTGFSLPNILAFNTLATLSDGGIPQGPETLTFTDTVSHVQINAGNSDIAPDGVTMECFDGDAMSLGQDTIAATGTLQTLAVTAPGIVNCVLDFESQIGVFDDLAFVVESRPPITEVPTLSERGLALLIVLLAVAGVLIARRSTAY